MHDPRLDRLAEVLVNYSTAVKKDDLVFIRGNTDGEPLVVAVYRAVLAAGGHPYVRLQSEECTEVFLKRASQRQLEHVSPIDRFVTSEANVNIGIWAEGNRKALSNVDPARQAAFSRARQPILDLFLQRAALPAKNRKRLRWVGTAFPTQAAAQDAEMSLSEYADFVFSAGKLDLKDPVAAWKQLGQSQQRLADSLNRGRELHITAPGGTDIRFGIKGRRWINCDGHENFPDGEVFTAPIEDSVEGTVHYSFPAVYNGREVQGVRLRFKAGRVVDASADRNEEFLLKMIDQDAGGRTLGEVAIGTNYSIQQFTKDTLFDEKIGGTFHAALGAAYPESGGKNKSGLHWDMVCELRSGGIIRLDGKPISKNGRFLTAAWPK